MDKEEFKKYAKMLVRFMCKNGYTKKPYPKITLKFDEQDPYFGKTAYYDPENKEVVLFMKNAFPKDRLRSLAHECIHHLQNMEGRLGEGAYSGEKIIEDDKLMKLEEEAYLKGNIAFRSFTETMQKKKQADD